MDIEQKLNNNKNILKVRKQYIDEFNEKVEIYSIRYLSDNYEVEGYVAAPKNENKQLPILIYNRGGNRDFGTIRVPLLCKIAQRGFSVFASQYRGNCGGTGKSDLGGDDVQDILNLISIALELEFTKKDGVYMLGESIGGMMTYRACSMDNRIKAAVVKSGVTDCVDMYNTREEGMKNVFIEMLGGTPNEILKEYEKRSAVNFAEMINCPILILHGSKDINVNVNQVYKIENELQKNNKEYKLIIYENEDHFLKGVKWLIDAIEWLKEKIY